jgi:hypothetical protein
MCQAIGHEQKYIFIFAPWGAPAPQTPQPRGVWGAGAPQGAKNKIKYRPEASYAQLGLGEPRISQITHSFVCCFLVGPPVFARWEAHTPAAVLLCAAAHPVRAGFILAHLRNRHTLCYAILPPGRKRALGPGFGRIRNGKTSKSALPPAVGVPESRC